MLSFFLVVVAESKSALQFRKVQGGGFQYYRGLEDKEYIVSGTMKILPGGQKPVGSGAKTSIVGFSPSCQNFSIPCEKRYDVC